LHKADRIEALDPSTHLAAPLFHPRRQKWSDHFAWDGFQLMGRTPTGNATITSLLLNHPRRILIREAEASLGLFSP
jgi:hypothetical protein